MNLEMETVIKVIPNSLLKACDSLHLTMKLHVSTSWEEESRLLARLGGLHMKHSSNNVRLSGSCCT